MLLFLIACGAPVLEDGLYETRLDQLDGQAVEEVDGSEDADFIDANTVAVLDCGIGVTANWNDVELSGNADGTVYSLDTVEKDDDFELIADGAEVSGAQDSRQAQVVDCLFEMQPVNEGEILSSTELTLHRDVHLSEVSGDCSWIELPCSWDEDWTLVMQ